MFIYNGEAKMSDHNESKNTIEKIVKSSWRTYTWQFQLHKGQKQAKQSSLLMRDTNTCGKTTKRTASLDMMSSETLNGKRMKFGRGAYRTFECFSNDLLLFLLIEV